MPKSITQMIIFFLLGHLVFHKDVNTSLCREAAKCLERDLTDNKPDGSRAKCLHSQVEGVMCKNVTSRRSTPSKMLRSVTTFCEESTLYLLHPCDGALFAKRNLKS